MGFPQKVKIEALTLAARHCCVSNRYKGLKIEIHHIEQEAHGGSNTIDNAIALCFDCHSDAGHYNSNHPKGTKFSKPELRKARELWYKRVQEHNLLALENTSDHLHFRHMILRNYEIASEILAGELKEFPFPSTVLFKTEILAFINSLSKQNKNGYQLLSIDYKTFTTEEEIFKVYPDAKVVDKSKPGSPNCFATRVPTNEALISIKKDMDPFILHMLNNKIDPAVYSQSTIYKVEGGCGDGNDGVPYYHEFIVFKSFWYTFLAITNTSNSKIELLELSGTAQNNDSLILNVNDHSQEVIYKLKFPKIALLPNESVLLPTSVVLVPFDEEYFNETTILENQMTDMRTQTLFHFLRDAQDTEYRFFGPYIKPKNITYNVSDRVSYSEMHELDLNNFFVLDRFWGMGSCPHLFFVRNGHLEYVKELFTQTPGNEMTERLIISKNVSQIVIVELEQETTYINKVIINQITTHEKVTLQTNEILQFKVKENDVIQINGYYVSFSEMSLDHNKMIIRNRIISNYLRHNINSHA